MSISRGMDTCTMYESDIIYRYEYLREDFHLIIRKQKNAIISPSRTSSLFLLPFVIMNIISQTNIAYNGEDKTEQEKIPKHTLPCHTKRKKNDLAASIMMM